MAELVDAPDSKSGILWMWGFDSPSRYQGNQKYRLDTRYFLPCSLGLSYHDVFGTLYASAVVHFFRKFRGVLEHVFSGPGSKTSYWSIASLNDVSVTTRALGIEFAFLERRYVIDLYVLLSLFRRGTLLFGLW